MREVADQLQPLIPWNVLTQFQKPKMELLDLFKNDVGSVLLATLSFWQGVDVPGESLSAVIIDRLPFGRANLPIILGRRKLIKSRGLNDFTDYYVPDMTLTLRQGLGRLLRNVTDRGLLAILDNRLLTKGYGRAVIKSLPPSPLVKNISEISEFLRDL
jgi:ATP-dependent DNA helicase DinG